jgi:hypothetical protein
MPSSARCRRPSTPHRHRHAPRSVGAHNARKPPHTSASPVPLNNRGLVDPEQPGSGAAQVAAHPWFGLERADELVAAPRGPAVGAVDQLFEVGDQVGADLLVAFGLLGVVADHEPLGPRTLVAVAGPAGGHRDLLDPQVVGHGAVAPGPRERGGGLGGWPGAASRRGGSARRRGSGAVPVGPPRLPQEHAYNSTASAQFKPGDTPNFVCLQGFRVPAALHRPTDQPQHYRSSQNLPTSCGSPVRLLRPHSRWILPRTSRIDRIGPLR